MTHLEQPSGDASQQSGEFGSSPSQNTAAPLHPQRTNAIVQSGFQGRQSYFARQDSRQILIRQQVYVRLQSFAPQQALLRQQRFLSQQRELSQHQAFVRQMAFARIAM